MKELEEGSTIGNYRIVRQLGRGGMGTVYEVEHVELGTRYALKTFTFDSDGETGDALKRKFLEEGKLLARLKHPNLTHVFDLGFEDETQMPYFVMDLVTYADGGTYTVEDIDLSGIDEEMVYGWFVQLASALDYIHGEGIVHRDIKPSNLLVDKDLNIVLTDFGISRIFGTKIRGEVDASNTMATKTGRGKLVLGTRHYIAPEVAEGGEATPRADAYSLGVMLLRWLTGFYYSDNPGAITLLTRKKYRWLPVISRLLAPADRRPDNYTELLALIQPPEPASVPSPESSSAESVPRADGNAHKKANAKDIAVFTAAALLIVLAVGGAIVGGRHVWRLYEADKSRQQEQVESLKRQMEEKTAADRAAREAEKAERERLAAEQAEAECLADEKAKKDAEAKRIAEESARREAETARAAKEREAAERAAKEKAEAERAAKEKAEVERAAMANAESGWANLWPTEDEFRRAKPVVEALMASKAGAEAKDVAQAALGLVNDAETRAARFLLLRMAVGLYAKAGDDGLTADAFRRMVETVGCVPLVVQALMLTDASRAISRQGRPARTDALRRQVEALVQIERQLGMLLQEARKSPGDAGVHLRAGNALAALGRWDAALAHLRASGGDVAALAERELGGGASAGDLADGWWKAAEGAKAARINVHVVDAYRAHATSLYRSAIAKGKVTGLAKTLAESRVAEVEKVAEDAIPMPQGNDRLLYCVIDLSGGPDAEKYPVAYMDKPPKGGFNTDEYKTTKLVLRRIEPGSFEMCGQYRVKLTRPYYIGVFEVTQRQYQFVTGNNPSKSKSKGDMRPVERVSYDMLRGASKGAKWPSSSDVDESSFMGRLRQRTKLDFDLPTEAQWEYACRAGTKSEYNNGGDKEDDLKKLGRFTLNQKRRGWKESDADFARHRPDNKGGYSEKHTVVGSYQPNRWGLYDMHGNMWEWCLDWEGDLSNNLTDPKGTASGGYRVLRGGSWCVRARHCRSASRTRHGPGDRDGNLGFRLCCSAGSRE